MIIGFITFLNVILNDIGSETNWAIFEWSKYVSTKRCLGTFSINLILNSLRSKIIYLFQPRTAQKLKNISLKLNTLLSTLRTIQFNSKDKGNFPHDFIL